MQNSMIFISTLNVNILISNFKIHSTILCNSSSFYGILEKYSFNNNIKIVLELI